MSLAKEWLVPVARTLVRHSASGPVSERAVPRDVWSTARELELTGDNGFPGPLPKNMTTQQVQVPEVVRHDLECIRFSGT